MKKSIFADTKICVMKERLENVDIAKGIGIVFVVCCHSELSWLMDFFLGMVIPIFFFSAGYSGVCKGPMLSSMKKRFRKLFVPYIFYNIILLLSFRHFSIREFVGVLYSRFSLFPLDVTPNIKFLTAGNYPLWFLTSMILAYFFYYFIIYNEDHRDKIVVAYIIITFLFMYCPILLPWSIDTAFLAALFMYAGNISRKKDVMSANIWQILLLILIYVGLRMIEGDINISVRMYGASFLIYYILGVVGSIVVLWGSKYLEKTYVGRVFVNLGQHSLTIFCVQMIFIVWAKDIYQYIFPQQPDGYCVGAFEIIFALVGGWLLSFLIHKNSSLSRLLFL